VFPSIVAKIDRVSFVHDNQAGRDWLADGAEKGDVQVLKWMRSRPGPATSFARSWEAKPS
jgi:hypothetical protein